MSEAQTKNPLFPTALNNAIDLQMTIPEVVSLVEALNFAQQTYKYLADQEATKGAAQQAEVLWTHRDVTNMLIEKILASTKMADAKGVPN